MLNNMIRKNWKRLITITTLSLVLTFAIEVIGFNWNILTLPEEQKGVQTIELSEIKTDNTGSKNSKSNEYNQKLQVDFKGKYVGKIKVDYKSENNFTVKITNAEKNSFSKYNKVNYVANYSFKTNNFTMNINSDSKKMELEFNEPINIDSFQVDNNININFNRIIFFFVFISSSMFLYVYRKGSIKKIENTFLFISLVCGTLIICFVPNTTFYSYDDETHFKNAYSLLDFGTTEWTDASRQMTIAMPFPFNSVNSKEDMINLNRYLEHNNEDITSTTSEGKFISYNKFAYLPSASFIKFAKIIDLPFSVMFKLGKFANLLFYSIMMYFAIKILTKGKLYLAFLALIPTNIWLASNYSVDPIILSSIALGISIFIKEFFDKDKKVSTKFMILYLFTMIFGILPKAIYAPLILLPLLLPHSKFHNKKMERNFKIGLVLVFIVIMSSFVLPAILSPSLAGDFRAQETSQLGQMQNILSHPLGYVNVFMNNAGLQFFNKFFGPETLSNFSYLGILHPFLQYISLIMLIVLIVIDFNAKKLNFNFKSRFLISGILLVVIGLIWTALYLDYTAVGSVIIQGVQGRYFIPLLILFPFIFNLNYINKITFNPNLIILYISFLILMSGIYFNILNLVGI